ncbi:NADH-quinone oxidoreductase subunit C [Conexibacter sp. DBS9H8]|uniref:hydrogenase large subunit n=1 Tax=Conexibacter sp. DBS9H8 TaxID=2937801 RepID=UPI00200D2EE8|nr:NADH-quinone oxidoreductase subunit C [Conexibacter sp. DBS9H8]
MPAQAWRRACLDAHAQGGQFGGLFASRRVPGAVQVRALFSTPAGEQLITCEAAERGVDTIVDAIPAAGWDEREAHDLHGIDFAGHEPLRPLLDHQQALEAWTVPTSGQDVHQVAVGPVHAGVIESGHFRFHVVGERILHLDVRLFYKRRGLETAATGRPLEDGIAYAQRMCAACSVANTVAYVHACEAALGCEPDEHVRRGRTILLELERVYNHLNDVSAICAGVGFAPGTMAYAALKERVQRLNHRLTRHRFLFDTVKLGTGSVTLDRDQAAAMRRELATIRHEHDSYWRELRFVTSLQRRLDGVATLSTADAVRLGAVGPVARASGVHRDHRHHSPRLLYHGFAAAVAPTSSGDVAARMNQRALELRQSFDLLDELLCQPAAHGGLQHVRPVSPIGIGRVESPRGETVCVIENDGGRLAALHLRTGSYANWPILAHTMAGELLPDFPLINKSFELCYACADR